MEAAVDQMNIDKFISEIKSAKIGQGLCFLPTTSNDLFRKLKEWKNHFVEKPSYALKIKILGLLDELLFRKNITSEEYKEIERELEI